MKKLLDFAIIFCMGVFMNFRKILSILLIIIWMITIFNFSHQQGTGSSKTSETVSRIIVNIYDINKHLNEEEKNELIEIINPIIRKMAHFTIYMLGGILLINYIHLFLLEIEKEMLYSACIGIIYAITDEIHQLFIVGRSGSIIDVLIDSIGIFTGISIFLFINKIVIYIRNWAKLKGGE